MRKNDLRRVTGASRILFTLTTTILAVLVASSLAVGEDEVAELGIFCADSARAWDERAADDADRKLVPTEARGDIRFTLDAVAFRVGPERRQVEIFVSVPHVALEWVRSGQSYRAELQCDIEVADRKRGRRRHLELKRSLSTDSFESTVESEAQALQVFVVDVDFDPVIVEMEIQDIRSKKSTLVGLIQGSKKKGTARAFLPQSWGPGPTVRVSNLIFGQDTRAAAEISVDHGSRYSVHGGSAVTPNPKRFVGHAYDVFPVYYEIYSMDRNGIFQPDSVHYRVRYRIQTSEGDTLLQTEARADAPSGHWGRLQRFSVSGYRTGTYALSVEVLDDAGRVLDAASGDFHVVWNAATFRLDEQTVLDHARVLLDPQTFDEFEDMPPGERAAYLIAFWQRLDPKPAEDGNVAYAEFERRMRRAEQRYGGLQRGKLSDRGRILIRFGDPDEVLSRRLPTRYDSLLTTLAEEINGSLGITIDRSDPRLRDFVRRHAGDNPAFEIWTYFGGGAPIVPEQAGPVRGMAFVFVDEVGTGFYRLGYTNVFGIM